MGSEEIVKFFAELFVVAMLVLIPIFKKKKVYNEALGVLKMFGKKVSLPPFLGHKTGKIKVIISLPRGLNFSRI